MQLEAKQLDQAREAVLRLPLDFLGLLRLEGPDVADYLQRVTSQDAEGLSAGSSAPACLLTGKGKMQAHFRLIRAGSERFYAETWRDRLGQLREQLDRFIFTEKIQMEILDPQEGLGLLGPEAPGLCTNDGSTLAADEIREADGMLWLRSDELGLPFCRIYGPPDAIAAESERLGRAGVPEAGPALFEALRIEAAQPLLGTDADETTIPLEVGLDAACDPDKGCYTGQEIIARIRTYGHVNRQLMRIRFSSPEPFEPGTLILDDGMQAGRLTSSYLSPEDGRWHALALLPLVVLEDADDLRLGSEEGPEVEIYEPS